MESAWPVTYSIDSSDHLTQVNEAFTAFADDNEGGTLSPDQVVGRLLWDFLTDETTKSLYRDMVQRVRRRSMPVRFKFRCDAPDLKRLLAMEIDRGEGDTVQFTITSVLEERVLSAARSAIRMSESGALLTICGWCKRVPLASGEWGEIEEAVDELGLFHSGSTLQLSHGMCPMCYDAVMGMIDDPEVGASGTVTLGGLGAT
ncbi:MAG: hypothetical protein H0W15_01425 [Gemmatimonadales bacterium]|nr:hypothetical protein [Gemmatimonadales bacterium]